MTIEVRSPRAGYGPTAALGVALALALGVMGAQPLEAPAQPSGASALSPKAAEVETRAIKRTTAIETAVLGSQHAAEHAAVLRAELKWARLGHQPHSQNPSEALSSVGATALASPGSPSQVGEWTQAPFQLPTFAINTTVLPTGKVLIWGRPPPTGDGSARPNVGEAALWSPWLGTGPNAFQPVTP